MLTKDASLALVYKNFAANRNISHIGLGVAALNTQKILRAVGLKADVLPILSADDLRKSLQTTPRTHIAVSAPWIPTLELQKLTSEHPETQFFVVSHSNVGFLQADANGVRLLREAMDLEAGTHNFHLAGNSEKFCFWVRDSFGVPCEFLPNCYSLTGFSPARGPEWQPGSTLRIGVFGATRPLKNLMSAAGAALDIARTYRSPLELWLSAGRAEGGGMTVLHAVQEMLKGLPGVELKFNGWQPWPQFRALVATMHLLLQPSYTESFNMVTADGVAMGVPSVVSDAIDWAPRHWKAEVDNVLEISRVGQQLLMNRNAAVEGMHALIQNNRTGVAAWAHALGVTDCPPYSAPAFL